MNSTSGNDDHWRKAFVHLNKHETLFNNDFCISLAQYPLWYIFIFMYIVLYMCVAKSFKLVPARSAFIASNRRDV